MMSPVYASNASWICAGDSGGRPFFDHLAVEVVGVGDHAEAHHAFVHFVESVKNSEARRVAEAQD